MSPFIESVLKVVKNIPSGKVASYGQVALLAGVPRGARQVGSILCKYGENTPWWRVINNAGRISVTCLDHTASIQKEKLIQEGIAVDEKLNIDIEKYRWLPDNKAAKKLEISDSEFTKLMENYFS